MTRLRLISWAEWRGHWTHADGLVIDEVRRSLHGYPLSFADIYELSRSVTDKTIRL